MPNGQPKPVVMLKGHRTKREKELREKAETELTTGEGFKEWVDVKNNVIAHKEFIRLKRIFSKIKKNDSLHESIINRYCLLHAEIKEFEEIKKKLQCSLIELHKQDMDFLEKLDAQDKILSKINTCDKKVMEKRKVLFDIEKENLMTMQSVLRSVPKQPPKEEEADPMAELLGRIRPGRY